MADCPLLPGSVQHEFRLLTDDALRRCNLPLAPHLDWIAFGRENRAENRAGTGGFSKKASLRRKVCPASGIGRIGTTVSAGGH